MTNLLEKSLLVGFGIFILVFFFSFIIPFYSQIIKYNEYNSNLKKYTAVIEDVNYGVQFIIRNPDLNYITNINYPQNLNITFQGQSAIFDYIINASLKHETLSFNKSFIYTSYNNLLSGLYLLNISIKYSQLQVLII